MQGLAIVGDPFARPMLAALEANPGRWDLSSLAGIISSGAMWSEQVKAGLLAQHPAMLLIDAFSSSEALGMGVVGLLGRLGGGRPPSSPWAPR